MSNRPSRILELPATGSLLVCTDLHGNLRDFERMVERFTVLQAADHQPFLLFSGDLIHGPNLEPAQWPEHLGSFFRDQSAEIVERFLQLQQRYPGRIACLIGNHEHSHVGGPHTPKFWDDETAYFEQSVGPERAARYNAAFAEFPLVAVSQCGVAVTHAAPNVAIDQLEELEVDYDGYDDMTIQSMYDGPVIARLLWSRSCPPTTARRFLEVINQTGAEHHFVVFGHDIVSAGYATIGDEQLQLSTSFGIADENKTYLELDLAAHYRSARELRLGVELKRLNDGDSASVR